MASTQCVRQCKVSYAVKVDTQISSDTVLACPDNKSYLALNPTTCLFELLSSIPSYAAVSGLFYTLTSTAQVVLTNGTTVLAFGSCLASNPAYVLTLANGGVPTISLNSTTVATLSQLLSVTELLTSAKCSQKVVPSQNILVVPSGASLVCLNPASPSNQPVLSVLPYLPTCPKPDSGTYYQLTPTGQVSYYVCGKLVSTFGSAVSGASMLKLALNAASVPEVNVTNSSGKVLQELHVGTKLVYKITEGASVYSDTVLATAGNTLFLVMNPTATSPGSAFGIKTALPCNLTYSDTTSYLLNTVGQIELTIKIAGLKQTVKFGAVLALANDYYIKLLPGTIPTVGVFLGEKQVASIDLTKPIPAC